MQSLKELNIVVVTHVFATGPAQELEDFLKDKVSFLMFIGHPFSYAQDTRSFVKTRQGNSMREKKAFRWKLPAILTYFKDVLYTFFWVMASKRKFDLLVGCDPLNALTGILLKAVGKVRRTVFYVVDYVPERFSNKLLNGIYHKIDSLCAQKSDFVWNLSQAMIEARKDKGVRREDNQLVVPIGVHFGRTSRRDLSGAPRRCLAYLGHLRKWQGLELVMESLPGLIEKLPDLRLVIIGTGDLENHLRDRVGALGVSGHVEFKGYVEDHREAEEILSHCSVGLALYEPHPKSFTRFSDPSKPKQYLACGLPIVVTRVAGIASKVEELPLGVVVDYSKEQLQESLLKLLGDDGFYRLCRENALKFASELKWDTIFEKTFEKTGFLC